MADGEEKFLLDTEIAYSSSGKEDVLAEAGEIEDAINNLSGVVDIGVSVDSSELDAISDTPTDIELVATLDDSDVLTELDAIDTTSVEPSVDPSLTDSEGALLELDAINEESLEPNVDPTLTDSEGAIQEVQDLDEAQVKPEIDPKETDQGKAVLDRLDFFRKLQIIELTISAVGNILEVISAIQDFTINPILETEDATARLAAQTGTLADEWDHFVNDILFDDLGESRDQIADVAIKASQIQIPTDQIDAATRATLKFTKTFNDQNPEETLRILNTLVEQGLVPNFEEGADLITAFFQRGGNRNNDALQAIQTYAVGLKDAGLTGNESLSAINSLMDAGFRSASDAARAITDFDNALTTAANNANSPQAEALRNLGIENPKEKGEAAGAEFFAGAVEAIKNSTDQETVINALFGKGGKRFTSAVSGLDFELFPEESVAGSADAAAATFDDTLRGAFDDFWLEVEARVQDFLSSEQIDLPGKLAAIKEGLADALEILTSGGTLGDALEEGLKIQGADAFITNLERVFGNAQILLLQVVAAIQEAQGQGAAAAATRTQIAGLAQGQLAFDLKIANENEIAGIVQTAIDRGVSADALNLSLQQSVTELIGEGEIGKARELVAAIGEIPGAVVEARGAFGVLDQRIEVPLDPTLSPAAFEEKVNQIVAENQRIGETVTATLFPIDSQALTTQVDAAAQAANDAWITAIQTRDFGTAAEIAKGFDPALIGETFKQALLGGDLLTAEDLAGVLQPEQLETAFTDAVSRSAGGIATEIANLSGDPELQNQAKLLADSLLTQFNNQLAEGDLESAGITAQLLGDEDLQQKVTDLQQQLDDAKEAVDTASDDMATAVEDADSRIADALTGNTVTDSFQAVKDSAEQNLTPVVAKFNEMPPIIENVDQVLAGFSSRAGGYFEDAIGGADDLYDALRHLGTGRVFVAGITTEVERLAGRLTSIFAQLQAAQGAGGGGGGGTVNNSSVTVSQTNTIQSGAQNASSNQQLLNELGGGG